MHRLLPALILAAALAPGLWWRGSVPERVETVQLDVTRLAVDEPSCLDPAGDLCREAAWVLTSPHSDFGGYSALVSQPGRLQAFSDRGAGLSFATPGSPAAEPRFTGTAAISLRAKRGEDVEAATRLPDGTTWVALESQNVLARLDASGRRVETIQPRGLAGWPGNTGPEALVHLRDGRLLVISESRRDSTGNAPALLVDPARPDEARSIEVALTPEYNVTGADLLPDGRIVILLRSFRYLPPGFFGRIAIADPEAIGPDGVMQATPVGRWAHPLPVDNFEGIVAEQADDGSLTVWLISDDNNLLLQRTIVWRLRWDGWPEG